MKLTTTIPLTLLSAISILPSTSAWKFTWRDDEGNQSTESGKGPHSCVKIQHAQGETFAWDNQGNENIGINLYSSSDCSGSMAGWSTDVWEKESSKDLLSFKVAREGDTTTVAATTGSHTGSADASATATVSTSGASNSTETGSASAAETKTKTKATTEASATGSSSAASSSIASDSTAENTGSSSTATGASGSGTPSTSASSTDGASTDKSSASSVSKSSAVMGVAGLALGMATFEWLA